MNTQDPIDIVRHFAELIDNGRDLRDIVRHGEGEILELKDELDLLDAGKAPGPDGVVGEAIDVMACMLDLIFVHSPETTNEDIARVMLLKCEKWARRYGVNKDGDRTID